MSHYKILSGAIAIAALVIFSSAGQAYYVGPLKVGDQCYKVGGSGVGNGYWITCPTTGATANASLPRRNAKRTPRAKKGDRQGASSE
jgi:hypothetical protein